MIEANKILAKMKNQKINYDRVLRKMISQWQRDGERPRILLHSCCAPCSTYTLEFLTQYADIAIYFANPNIHPKNEYLRRAKVQEQFVKDFNSKTDLDLDIERELREMMESGESETKTESRKFKIFSLISMIAIAGLAIFRFIHRMI